LYLAVRASLKSSVSQIKKILNGSAVVALALSRHYPAHLALTDNWTMPPGAFMRCGGPS
jgi:hypothetical protein